MVEGAHTLLNFHISARHLTFLFIVNAKFIFICKMRLKRKCRKPCWERNKSAA
jgi:hypothetical protein